MSKKVKRFLLVGRVVRKKLTRATQHKLEMVKESRQRSNFTVPAAITANYSTFDNLYQTLNQIIQSTELVFAGRVDRGELLK